ALGEAQRDQLAIDLDPIARADLLPDRSRQAVDQDAPGHHPLLDLAPRGDAGLREHLLQALGLGERGRCGASAVLRATARRAFATLGLAERGTLPLGVTRRIALDSRTARRRRRRRTRATRSARRTRAARLGVGVGVLAAGLAVLV